MPRVFVSTCVIGGASCFLVFSAAPDRTDVKRLPTTGKNHITTAISLEYWDHLPELETGNSETGGCQASCRLNLKKDALFSSP